MQIDWLKTFILCARFENFRIAAETRFITQPAVTFQIKQLESEIGSKLFHREGRRVFLTEDGEWFLKHAEQIVADYEKAVKGIVDRRKGDQTTLTIAASPLVAGTQLPYLLRRYLKERPDIEFNIKVAESNEIEAFLLNKEADVGFSRQAPGHTAIGQTIVSEDPVVMVVPFGPNLSDTEAAVEYTEYFQHLPLITHNHPEYWDALLKELFIHRSFKTMAISQVSTTKRFIEEGLGFSFLPHLSVRRELAEGRVLLARDHPFHLPTTRTYLLNYEPNAVARHFGNFVTQLMR